uniref:Cytochrome c oxidase assembly protein COX16 homolog, mitochondrial n=1 Tax=Clastoptera arizonana TaxID=38151 RepID=A0A1B6DCY2_9HEMI
MIEQFVRLKSLIIKFNNKRTQRFFKYGAPFLILMLGGSFGLKMFTNLRYEYKPQVILRPEDLEKEGIYMKKPEEVTLESEYEKIKNLDIDNWKNIRGPRPWEEEPAQQNK